MKKIILLLFIILLIQSSEIKSETLVITNDSSKTLSQWLWKKKFIWWTAKPNASGYIESNTWNEYEEQHTKMPIYAFNLRDLPKNITISNINIEFYNTWSCLRDTYGRWIRRGYREELSPGKVILMTSIITHPRVARDNFWGQNIDYHSKHLSDWDHTNGREYTNQYIDEDNPLFNKSFYYIDISLTQDKFNLILNEKNKAGNNNTIRIGIYALTNDTSYHVSPISYQKLHVNYTHNPIFSDTTTYTINENSPIGTTVGNIVATDQDSNSLTFSILSGNEKSIFGIINSSLSKEATIKTIKNINYEDIDQNTQYTLEIEVTDGTSTIKQNIIININDVNDAPIINDQLSDKSTNEDTNFTIINLDNTVNDEDHSDDKLIWSHSAPTNLIITSTNRKVTISPTPTNWHGSETITFTVSDGTLTDTQSITFTVTPINDPPIINDQLSDKSTNEDTDFTIINLDTVVDDVDHSDDKLIWSHSTPTNLIISSTNRKVTISPTPTNWHGSETITFTVSDGTDQAVKDVLFTVSPVNDAPSISTIPNQTIDEGSSFSTIQLDNFVSDVDNEIATLVWTHTTPTNLTITSLNRVVTITPIDINWYGNETITFTVSDGTNQTDKDVLFTVNPVNDSPTITQIPNQIINKGSQTDQLNFTVNDIESDNTTLEIFKQSSNTGLVPNENIIITGIGSDRSVLITPLAAEDGRAEITLTISDTEDTTSQRFYITVIPGKTTTYTADKESKITLWLDGKEPLGTKTNTLANNDKIPNWIDYSGKNHHLSQQEKSKQPFYNTTTQTVDFDGIDDELIVSNIITSEVTTLNIIIIFESNDNTKEQTLLSLKSNNGINWETQYNINTLTTTITDGTSEVINSTKAEKNKKYISYITYTPTELKSNLNYIPTSTVGIGKLPFTTSELRIGNNINSYFSGKIYEIIIFNETFTEEELQKTHQYLSKKWSLFKKVEVDLNSTETKKPLESAINLSQENGKIILNNGTSSEVLKIDKPIKIRSTGKSIIGKKPSSQ